MTHKDFPLPTLGPKLKQFTEEVVNGRGFQFIRGVPVDRYTAADATIVYWGLGTYWGRIVPQNKKAHLVGHVRVSSLFFIIWRNGAQQHSASLHLRHSSMDAVLVQDIHRGDGLSNPLNRLYSTNAAEPWHVDDADVVGAQPFISCTIWIPS